MRIRTIKPEFWMSESVGRLSRDARLLFIGLWSACDDFGRTRAASRFLASLLYPYDEDATKNVCKWIAELEKEKMVRVYHVDGCTYLEIPKWQLHQKIDHPTKSKLPEFEDQFAKNSEVLARTSEKLALDQGTGIREIEQGSGNREASREAVVIFPENLNTPAFRVAWARYEEYRRQAKMKKLKPMSIESQLKECSQWGVDASVEAIDQTIAKGWQGIFEPKPKLPPNGVNKFHQPASTAEDHNRDDGNGPGGWGKL